MEEKYLPIGTVVKLKELPTKMMITCYVVFSENASKGKVYDYGGCPYPTGLLEANKVAVFDHEDIEKIIYMGYKDDDYKGMVEFLLTKQDEIKKHIDEKLSKEQENEA